MNDIKVKNRRVNKKKALIMILLGITILGVINRTWAYVDAVSYTHLDVYKRQIQEKLMAF